MGFDVSRLSEAKEARESGVTFTVTDPKTGKELEGVTITVASYSSERVKGKARGILEKWEAKKIADPSFMPGFDEREALTVATACAAVVSWDGFESEGKPWPCNQKNIEALISDPAMASQVDKVAGDESRFFTR